MKAAGEMLIKVSDIPADVLFAKSPRAKKLSITIKPFTPIRITIPRRMSYETARKFLSSNLEWVKNSISKVRQIERREKSDHAEVPAIDKREAKISLIIRLNFLAQKYGFSYSRVTVRNQRTRWGSCSRYNNISLNMNLVRLPQELRDYVILHELVHTRVKNHSKRFWAEVEKYVTGAKAMDKRLRNYDLTRFHYAA